MDIPIYRYDRLYAKAHEELDLYWESQKANIACRDAIEKAIADNSKYEQCGALAGVSFDAATAAKQVVMEFGMERTAFVVANHIRGKDWDKRYSWKNREWAQSIPFFEEMPNADRSNNDYTIRDSKAHAVIVDAFATKIRELYQLAQGDQ